jgi:hypothetical protein
LFPIKSITYKKYHLPLHFLVDRSETLCLIQFIETQTTGDEMTYLLTSSCRASSVSFASVSEAEAFLASRKLSEETVCLCDKAGNVIFTRTYN